MFYVVVLSSLSFSTRFSSYQAIFMNLWSPIAHKRERSRELWMISLKNIGVSRTVQGPSIKDVRSNWSSSDPSPPMFSVVQNCDTPVGSSCKTWEYCNYRKGVCLTSSSIENNHLGMENLFSRNFLSHNAPVKLFFPIPPGQPLGQRKNLCDKKGRRTGKWCEKRAGHWKIRGLQWLLRAGKGTNKVIRRPGQHKKSEERKRLFPSLVYSTLITQIQGGSFYG